MKELLLALFVCAAVTVSADIGPQGDVTGRARGAGRIVVGRVADVQSRFGTNRFGDQLIVSTVVVDVLENMKGPGDAQVRVEVEGGTVGDLTLKVSDMTALRTGDRAVFFLNRVDGGAHVPQGRGRGIMKLGADDRVEGSAQTLADVRRQVRAALAEVGR